MDAVNFSEFLKVSHDYLMLLNSKIKRAEINKGVADEVGVLDTYYMAIESLFKRYEQQHSEMKHYLFQERLKSKMLENELSLLMKASIDRDENEIERVVKMSKFDVSKIDMTKKVEFKKNEKLPASKFKAVQSKYKKGTPLSEILNHFSLTEKQLIQLVDG